MRVSLSLPYNFSTSISIFLPDKINEFSQSTELPFQLLMEFHLLSVSFSQLLHFQFQAFSLSCFSSLSHLHHLRFSSKICIRSFILSICVYQAFIFYFNNFTIVVSSSPFPYIGVKFGASSSPFSFLKLLFSFFWG